MRKETRVHNISDRGDNPMALRIGRDMIRPGKSFRIDSALVTPKLKELHGVSIWIGDVLPGRLRRLSKSAIEARSKNVVTSVLSVQEARSHLEKLSEAKLQELCEMMVPTLVFTSPPSKRSMISRLARSLFTNRVLDPESFFWLGRWTIKGDIYTER